MSKKISLVIDIAAYSALLVALFLLLTDSDMLLSLPGSVGTILVVVVIALLGARVICIVTEEPSTKGEDEE